MNPASDTAPAATPRGTAFLMSMMDEVQHYFMNELEGGIAAHAGRPEAWAFVGMNVELALAQLGFARGFFPAGAAPAFLDCGAGLGFIGMLARGLGFRPSGIELSRRYVELAGKLFPWAQVREGDVLTYADYGEHDAIFYYGPFKDETLQAQFEQKVEAEAKSGAIIIANRKVSAAWSRSTRFRLLRDDGFMGCIIQKVHAA